MEPEAPRDWIQEAVERVHGPLPDGWKWCRSEVLGDKPNDVFVIEGGVPRVLKRGPNKGRTTWRDAVITKYVLTRAQVDEVKV